jgi:hypothetical protein
VNWMRRAGILPAYCAFESRPTDVDGGKACLSERRPRQNQKRTSRQSGMLEWARRSTVNRDNQGKEIHRRSRGNVDPSPRMVDWITRHAEIRVEPSQGPFHRDTPPDVSARDHERWQVSWLAGRRLEPPSQVSPVAYWLRSSPLTVAGAAAASLVGEFTAFPFDPFREPSRTGNPVPAFGSISEWLPPFDFG